MLKSKLFKDDELLQACALRDPAHITLGAHGDHVSKIHTALLILDGVSVLATELKTKQYGKSTADAILRYKTKRKIINAAYQTAPDNIVGKMTIQSLDDELIKVESSPQIPSNRSRHLFT